MGMGPIVDQAGPVIALAGDALYWVARISMLAAAPLVAIMLRILRDRHTLETAPFVALALWWLEWLFWGHAAYSATLISWYWADRPFDWLWVFGYFYAAFHVLPAMGFLSAMCLALANGRWMARWGRRVGIGALTLFVLILALVGIGIGCSACR